ncbi:MAG TPA: YbhB/YbcL family Raf kinase inhibitor-like protein [Methanoregulaceae archaeon]|nr:YbhB/YbcL family Raf kinase inhibitor-like protein [Methanoregulaceae archaeon]
MPLFARIAATNGYPQIYRQQFVVRNVTEHFRIPIQMQKRPEKEPTMENLIISLDFDKSKFPNKHTCDGEDISPLIRLDRIHSKYLAIVLDDIIGPSEIFTHWLIWNFEARDSIPENVPKQAEIAEPFKAIQGTNDFGTIGYRGPCPPPGEGHSYYFNVYGFDIPLDIAPGAKRTILMKAMEGRMVQYGGQAIAVYQR